MILQAMSPVDIYSELHRNIQDCFNEYWIQIMSPHYVGDPAQGKVVPKEKCYSTRARPIGEEGKDGKKDA